MTQRQLPRPEAGSPPAVRQERSGWRDISLQERHRKWGWDVPALDIDFIEADNFEPVALVEYKQERAQAASRDSFGIKVLVNLANRAHLPCFGVRYTGDFATWIVTPLNNLATRHITMSMALTEAGWVELLYALRGRTAPPEIAGWIDVQHNGG